VNVIITDRGDGYSIPANYSQWKASFLPVGERSERYRLGMWNSHTLKKWMVLTMLFQLYIEEKVLC
jgi:hypothetical protein